MLSTTKNYKVLEYKKDYFFIKAKHKCIVSISDIQKIRLQKNEQIYLKNFQGYYIYHNDNGPSRILLSENRIFIEWMLNGEYHNQNGPARIEISKNITTIHWFLFGVLYSSKEYISFNKICTFKKVIKNWIPYKGFLFKSIYQANNEKFISKFITDAINEKELIS